MPPETSLHNQQMLLGKWEDPDFMVSTNIGNSLILLITYIILCLLTIIILQLIICKNPAHSTVFCQ